MGMYQAAHMSYAPGAPRQRGVGRYADKPSTDPRERHVHAGAPSHANVPDPLTAWLHDSRQPFQGRHQNQEPLSSPNLWNRGHWPEALQTFTGGLRQTAARGTNALDQTTAHGPWALRYHAVIHQSYINVPLWAAVGPPRFNAGQNRQQFRRPQPGIKTAALAKALQNSAAAIVNARGARMPQIAANGSIQ